MERQPANSPSEQGEKPSRGKRAARAELFAEMRALTPYAAVEVGDELFVVATDDLGPGRELFVKRDSRDMVILSRALARIDGFGVRRPPSAVFVDVGANIGTTTIAALRRHGFASGVALEPSPANYRLLRLNLLANDLDRRVRALPVAVSARAGEVQFDATDPKHGRHHIAETPVDSEHLVVEAVTLDGLVADGVIEPPRVGLLWLDAAGHEGRILDAATTLLEAGVPIVTALQPARADPLRRAPESWLSVVPRLLDCYTEMVDLRRPHPRNQRPISELSRLVEVPKETHDLLFVRR